MKEYQYYFDIPSFKNKKYDNLTTKSNKNNHKRTL